MYSKWVARGDLSGVFNSDSLDGSLEPTRPFQEQEAGDAVFGGASTKFNELLTVVRVVLMGHSYSAPPFPIDFIPVALEMDKNSTASSQTFRSSIQPLTVVSLVAK